MTRASRIEKWLLEMTQATHLQVINESSSHNVPVGSESHFRLVVVSVIFEGKTLVERHRLIYDGLQTELSNSTSGGPALHALSLQLHTPAEWASKNGTSAESPDCLGGDGSLPKRRS